MPSEATGVKLGDHSKLRIIHLDDSSIDLDRVQSALANSTLVPSRFQVESFQTLSAFRERLRSGEGADLALLDVHLQGGADGMELASEVRKAFPEIVILFFSAARDSKTIFHSFKMGADDFISKRSDREELALRISRSYELALLKRGVAPILLGQDGKLARKRFVGRTLERISARIPLLLNSAVSAVYVEGESGTGKEVVADLFAECLPPAIPFVRMNCASLAPSLMESELFGHARGSFTGAQGDKKGLLESSSGGWLFLDEVGCLTPQAQAALLRALENHEIRRVGETQIRSVRFRVISANNESLQKLVQEGKFRRDLQQRLNEVEIFLPPLRERKAEIPEIIEYFCGSMEGGPYQVTAPALEILMDYDWKEGNIRELRNCLKAMTEFQMNRSLSPLGIPNRIWSFLSQKETGEKKKAVASLPQVQELNFDAACLQLLSAQIHSVIEESGPISLRRLSEKLGVSRKRLSGLMKDLVEKGHFQADELNRWVGF